MGNWDYSKSHWITMLCIGALFIATITCSIISSNISIEQTEMRIIDGDKVKSIEMFDYPSAKKYLDIASNISLALLTGLLVSVFITRTVEKERQQSEQKELAQHRDVISSEINANVFDAVFRSMVPKAIFKLMKEQIIMARAIRKNAHWFLIFRENEFGSLSLSQTLDYDLENIGHTPLPTPITLNSDSSTHLCVKSIVGTIDGARELDIESSRDIKQLPNGEFESVNPCIKVSKDAYGYWKFDVNIEIPPQKTMKFTIEYVDTYKGDLVKDGYFSKYPITDVMLRIDHPESWNLDVFFTYPAPWTNTRKGLTSSMYEAKEGILPGQGHLYTLTKKTEQITSRK